MKRGPMANFYRPPAAPSPAELELDIDSLDLHGRGVGRCDGGVCFVAGALPGERVRAALRQRGRVREGRVLDIIRSSPQRQRPFCELHGRCGGCPLYYAPPRLVIRSKIAGLRQVFAKNAGLELPDPQPLADGPLLYYRRTARLAVDCTSGRARVGFRAAGSHEVLAVSICRVLRWELMLLVPALAQLLDALHCRRQVGHIDLACGDEGTGMTIRLCGTADEHDLQCLREFARSRDLYLSLLTPVAEEGVAHGGPEADGGGGAAGGARSARDTEQGRAELQEQVLHVGLMPYVASSAGVLEFTPRCFVQVSSEVSEAMTAALQRYVGRAAGLRVLDLFCGFGNFAFALALQADEVLGCDVSEAMIAMARHNAQRLGQAQVHFRCMDLDDGARLRALLRQEKRFDVAVIDPGRAGAGRAVGEVAAEGIARVVMFSCNPTTCSRDCAQLVQAGYHLVKYQVFDMFAYTVHIEIMLCFERG